MGKMVKTAQKLWGKEDGGFGHQLQETDTCYSNHLKEAIFFSTWEARLRVRGPRRIPL